MPEPRRPLFGRLRASLLFRVLAIYAGTSWVVLEIADTFGSQFGLPTWFFPVAVGLLLVGLPIILATAVAQQDTPTASTPAPLPDFEIKGGPGSDPRREVQVAAAAPAPHPLARWLTWRKSILGGALGFTALAAVSLVVVLRGSARVTEAYGAAGDAFGERAWIVVADFESPADEPDLAAAVREALTVDLQQSRYVNVYTRSQMAGVLRLMELADTTAVHEELARAIAQREGLAAVLAGRVSKLGSNYVLAARVLRPASAEELVAVRVTAARDRLVDAVEALSREIRQRLGESRAAIRTSQPLPRVTTRSLEALERYSQAVEALGRGDQERAIDLAEAAIALDPEFAMAHRLAGVVHGNLFRWSERDRYTTRAYELREKLSERERLHIEAHYAATVLADPLEAIAAYELILSAYPDDGRATNNLSVSAWEVGDYERAYRSALRTVELDPYYWTGYGNAIGAAGRLDRWAAADSLAHLAMRRGLTDPGTRWLREQAVAEGDWARADAVCDSLLATTSRRGEFRADDESQCGYLDIARGRIGRAVERLRRAAELRSERGQDGFYYWTTAFLAEAEQLRGRWADARGWLDRAVLAHPPDSIPRPDRFGATFWAAYAAAQLRDPATAARYAAANATDTTNWLEAAWSLRLQAVVAVAAGRYEAALDYDRRAVRRHFGRALMLDQLYRAQAFDGLQQPDSAVALYEDVVAPHSSPDEGPPYLVYLPVIHRRLGELYAELDQPAKAAEHYEAFLELWSDADPELRPQVEGARRALERLGTERRTSALSAPSSPARDRASPSAATPSIAIAG